MDTKSRLADNPAAGESGDELSPQERLQRLADAFDAGPDWPEGHISELVAAAQKKPARAEAVASVENRPDGSGWRRNVVLFFVIVAAVTGVAGAILQLFGPGRVQQGDSTRSTLSSGPIPSPPQAAPPATSAQLQSGQTAADANATKVLAPYRPLGRAPAVPAPNNAVPPGSAITRQSVDTPQKALANATPPAVDPTRPDVAKPVTSQRAPAVVTEAAPAAGAASISDADAGRPSLSIVYQAGSGSAEDSARSLKAQVGSNVTGVDLNPRSDLPKVAVIRYSQEKNHALARSIGPLLTNMGYSWRIESGATATDSPRGVIEVSLPTK
jgi:hypothetical protein